MKTLELLEELGMETAAKEVKQTIEEEKKVAELKPRIMMAYEHFRVATPEVINRFNEELRKRTERKNQWGSTSYESLRFTALGSYGKIPPQEALLKVKEAKDMKIFDSFEVCDLQTIEQKPDPIIFGRITGCEDRFFVCQWDNDISISDILKENEG